MQIAGQPGPEACFLSHSYSDQITKHQCLRSRMPGGRTPFVFPPIPLSPDQAVSEKLVDAIRDCGGFAYLASVRSRDSFWVGFERNVAARLGKAVYAFCPNRPFFKFVRDRRPASDPIIAVVFNVCVFEDIQRIQVIRAKIWDRYHFQIRGDKWDRIDNDARQMLDSIPGLSEKYAAGGISLLFLSNESITGGLHDYADPYAFRRAQTEMETPVGYTAEKFARLDPAKTVFLWLDEPDLPAIEAALRGYEELRWNAYCGIIRHALSEPVKLTAFQSNGAVNLNHLDTMLARCFARAMESDPRIAAEFGRALVKAE